MLLGAMFLDESELIANSLKLMHLCKYRIDSDSLSRSFKSLKLKQVFSSAILQNEVAVSYPSLKAKTTFC